MGARGTFTGGIHPYDGKDLSKDKPIKDVLPKGISFIRYPSISVHRLCRLSKKETMC